MLLALALWSACRSNNRAFPVEVLFSRCARVFRGPSCELKEDRVVALSVASTTLDVGVSGIELHREVREGGLFVEVVVPPEAPELLVRTPRRQPFRLALASPTSSAELDQAMRLKKEGNLVAARAILESSGDLAPQIALRKRSLLARVLLAEGRADAAIAMLSETMREHDRAGDVSEALLDGEALAWTLLHHGRRFAEARAVLASLENAALVDPEGAVQVPYYQALILSESGDVRSALTSLRVAETGARRLKLQPLLTAIDQVFTLQLDALGRHEEALERLHRLAATPPDDVCQQASLLTNLGWVCLQANCATSEARKHLEGAARVFATTCPRPSEAANALTNLALASVMEGDLEAAERALDRSRATLKDDARLELWRISLDARIALARGRPQEALAFAQRLERLASAVIAPEAAWRAAVGQATALIQLQQHAAAHDAFRRAERRLDEEYRRLPLAEGLHTLLSEREKATGEFLELLIGLNRTEEAFTVARHARTRALRHLAALERVSRLEPARRERWERAVASHVAARLELDRAASLDWQLSFDKLASARAGRAREAQAIQAALDDALAELGLPDDPLRPVEPGELMLMTAPSGTRSGFLLFAATPQHVSAHPLQVGPHASPEALAAGLFGAIAQQLAAAERVSWLPWGRWHDLDLQSLSFNGQLLGAWKEVSWRVDVSSKRARASLARGALLVSDPTKNLPGARAEGMRVRPFLEAPASHLEGTSATSAKVREGMRDVRLFHYAGHAKPAGVGGFESELTLHEGRLTVADLLTLSAPTPPLVILSGCETGTSRSGGVEALGLAQAFVLAGSEAVVATEAPLDDRLAAKAMECLHARRPVLGTAKALRAAFLEPGCEAIRSYRLYRP
jgi:tetratricopeptide (TPR) repeat protein